MNSKPNSLPAETKDRVLFVDDEAFILFSLRRYFRQHNIDVDVETDCIKAVEMVKENNYKVIISDFNMPSMNGADFLDVVKDVSPSSVRLMLSAYISQETLLEIINKSEVFKFINKPWKDQELLNIIKDSIIKYDKDKKDGEIVLAPVISPVTETIVDNSEITLTNLKALENDSYIEDILPKENYDNIDLKKLAEILRTEQHQHLNYVINLVSSKIGNHCKRVSQLSAYMGNIMKLDAVAQKNLYYAGMYHDIGKIYELAAQADHSELGANILSNFIELKEAAKIVRYHHKRLDEEGAASIPIESKILSIVDHFDKEIHTEVNQELDEKPKTLTSIIAEMEQEKNKRFDSDILDVFKDVILKNFKLEMFFNERKIHIAELEEAMVLSRPLFNIEGKMLLNSEFRINKEVLKRLNKHNEQIGIKNPFYVYATVPEKSFNFEELISKKIKI
ncbi:MAG: response regulator [Bdellovibrionales bacterium]|nr:response regulator [Bdellovibrionales bacterium]